MTLRCLVDGEPANSVPLDDRAVQYGDGLFETFRVEAGVAQFLQRHLARLAAGCERLGFPAVDWPGIRDEVEAFVADESDGVLKLVLTRGSSRRGYAIADATPVRRILCLSAAPHWPGEPARAGIRMRVCDTRLAIQPRLAGIKHLNRLEQVLARREWQDETIREGLMCDTQARVIEGTMSNVFLVHDGVLHTPRLGNCGVAGVMRSVIIDLATQAAVPLEIRDLSRQDVQQADELFICNSLIGIWPVVCIDGMKNYTVGGVTRSLQDLLQYLDDHGNNSWYAT